MSDSRLAEHLFSGLFPSFFRCAARLLAMWIAAALLVLQTAAAGAPAAPGAPGGHGQPPPPQPRWEPGFAPNAEPIGPLPLGAPPRRPLGRFSIPSGFNMPPPRAPPPRPVAEGQQPPHQAHAMPRDGGSLASMAGPQHASHVQPHHGGHHDHQQHQQQSFFPPSPPFSHQTIADGYPVELLGPAPERPPDADAEAEVAAFLASPLGGRAPTSKDKVAILNWGGRERREPAKMLTCPLGPCLALPTAAPAPDLAAAQNGGMGYLLYGSRFGASSLPPLPKAPSDVWAFYSEESPLNFPPMSLPTFTALLDLAFTVNSASDAHTGLASLPGPRSLFDRKPQPLSVKARRRAPVLYMQTHTPVPSRRDEYVLELMKHIEIDCPGKVFNNMPLPPDIAPVVTGVPFTLYDEPTIAFAGSWKFTLAFENSRCNDYVTEKLWRPLIAGSVPVYRGSPSVRKWLPDPRMVILVDDFDSPAALAAYLHYLNRNDTAYNEHLAWKNSPLAKAVRKRAGRATPADSQLRETARAALPLWRELEEAALPWMGAGGMPAAACALCDTLRVALGQSPADTHPAASEADLVFARLPRPPSFADANAFTCWDEMWDVMAGAAVTLSPPQYLVDALAVRRAASSRKASSNATSSKPPRRAAAPSGLHGSGGTLSPAPGTMIKVATGQTFMLSWAGAVEVMPDGSWVFANGGGNGPQCPVRHTHGWDPVDERPAPWASKPLHALASPDISNATEVAAAAGWPSALRQPGVPPCRVNDPVTDTCPSGLVYVARGGQGRVRFV